MTIELKWDEVEDLIEQMLAGQKNELLKMGRRIIPHLTPEDVLQPNDYQELEYHPHFRYEEGVLAGVQMVQIALRALKHRLE
jgi:hypothetical protein